MIKMIKMIKTWLRKKTVLIFNIGVGKYIKPLFIIILIASFKYIIYVDLLSLNINKWIIDSLIIVGAYLANSIIINDIINFLGIKGINLKFKVGFFRMEKMKHYISNENKKPFEKITNNAMMQNNSNDKDESSNNDNKPVTFQDKGKQVESSNASFVPYSGIDPADIFPKRINPGPGFNVPGGEVPIRDEICKHIDYNTYILRQFKNMDLDTAIKQRNNNLTFVRRLDEKLAYARDALSKVPTNSTTEQEFKLKNQILSDLEVLGRDRIRADARATLINSRVEFIQKSINNN